RCLRSAEAAWRAISIVPARIVELWVPELRLVEDIKDFNSELASNSLRKLPILDHRSVPNVQAVSAKHISAHIAVTSQSRRDHDRTVFDKAAPFLERHVAERSRRASQRGAGGIINSQIRSTTAGGRCCAGQEERNGFRLQPAEGFRIAKEIPAITVFADSCRIVRAVSRGAGRRHTPGQRALNADDRRNLPAFHHLA